MISAVLLLLLLLQGDMGFSLALSMVFVFALAQFPSGFTSPITGPAFLWSPHHLGSSDYGVKDVVDYRTISPKDLAKTVLSEGGWSNLVQAVDIALVFIGRKLQSSDISKNKDVDRDLINLLKDSFTTSNFSMAFPYVSISEETETMENSLISGFTENRENHLGVNDVAFMGSCSIEGEGLTKLTSLHAVHEHVGSRMQRKKLGQTDTIVFCDGHSQPSEEFEQKNVEGEILSQLIDLLKQSGAKYAVLYASDPYRSLQYPSHLAMKRFLAEGTVGNAPDNSTRCDGVCQIKSSLLEGVFVGIVLLIILLSGLCCMMGIDTPTRFETPQES
ncbi:hypothetical protein AAC387_Pa03g0761 [Persea americana]